MRSRRLRVLRGSLTAALAVVMAAFFHVAGGGANPGAVGVFLALALSMPLGIALIGRRLSVVRVTLTVLLAQVAFHMLFSSGADAAAVSIAGGAHAHHGQVALMLVPEPSGSGMPAGMTMWAAHLLAAVLTVAGVWLGERSCRAMTALARQGVRAVVLLVSTIALTAPVVVRQLVAVLARLVPHELDVARALDPLRGPPALA